MKKCSRCKVVFHNEERQRCLYCDAFLNDVDEDDTDEDILQHQPVGNIIEKVLKEKRALSHESMQYLIGCYFHTRTFNFLYSFSRNEFKMGKDYRRPLVQPLSISSVLTLPWIVVILVDSLIFRIFYSSYCPECQWKYSLILSGGAHKREDCEYHKEYMNLIKEILSGRILKTEKALWDAASEKVKAGQRSAYYDLCLRENKYEGALDVACIWFSCGLLMYVIVVFKFPIMLKGVLLLQL